jgi:hypothetical protein
MKTSLFSPYSPVHITVHARDRARERFSMEEQSLARLAERAWYMGISLRQSKGRLRRYFDTLWESYGKADNIRLYGQYVFIFSGQVLLTLWHLPVEYRKHAHVLQSSKSILY